MAQTQTQLYTHAAEPKPVQQRRPKYRDEEQAQYPSNIMFDRRVVRGNTYAARILPADNLASTSRSTMKSTARGKTSSRAPPRTPEAVEGRKHIDVQTDAYLEELTDVVPETENSTQTDPFLDRPPTPLFVPQKTGTDAVTQIDQGDLFDFDFEVEPILEVLVGKVLEQGLMEVLEEEELAALRAHQEHFEHIRNAELVATQRMEAAERRKLEEKERRMQQEAQRLERERVVRQKVAASAFARGYLNGIVNSVFDNLQREGFFFDPVEREVATQFMPWLQTEAVRYLEQGIVARQVVAQLVEAAAAQMSSDVGGRFQRQADREDAEDAATAAHESAAGAYEANTLTSIRHRATMILHELNPPLIEAAILEATIAELKAAAEQKANEEWEKKKAEVAETTKADAEAKAAAQAEEAAAAAAEAEAAAAAAAEEGAEGEAPAPAPAEAPPPIDVQALVDAAVAAVEKPPVAEVTDGDVLSALLDKGLATKDNIINALALQQLGDQSYINDPAFGPKE